MIGFFDEVITQDLLKTEYKISIFLLCNGEMAYIWQPILLWFSDHRRFLTGCEDKKSVVIF